jgi:hypothetical protein
VIWPGKDRPPRLRVAPLAHPLSAAELYLDGAKIGEKLLDIVKTGWLRRDGTVELDAGDLQFDEVRLGATGNLRFSVMDAEFETDIAEPDIGVLIVGVNGDIAPPDLV